MPNLAATLAMSDDSVGGRQGAAIQTDGNARIEVTVSVEAFAHEPRIAYFSMEIALPGEIPTYRVAHHEASPTNLRLDDRRNPR